MDVPVVPSNSLKGTVSHVCILPVNIHTSTNPSFKKKNLSCIFLLEGSIFLSSIFFYGMNNKDNGTPKAGEIGSTLEFSQLLHNSLWVISWKQCIIHKKYIAKVSQLLPLNSFYCTPDGCIHMCASTYKLLCFLIKTAKATSHPVILLLVGANCFSSLQRLSPSFLFIFILGQ